MDDVAALADERDEVQVVHSVVPVDATQYYGGVYWNSYADVIGYMNRRVTGDDGVDVWEWFHRQTGRTFRRALVINCGNGWVERLLLERGFIQSAVGIDVIPELIEDARASARALPLRYEVADTNQADFPDDDFDLVVNHAAFHHVAYLDRVLRRCCELLPADGLLVNHDYVGAHRNQYGYDAWSQVHRVNQQLPERLRQKLVYPHLPTMLVTDPTEAVHSELTLAVTRRYFDLDEYRSVGGAIAYPLLTHNQAMAAAPPELQHRWISHILREDESWEGGDLFAFYYGRPRKAALDDSATLDRWRDEEEERERQGAAADGTYYERTLLQDLTQRLSDAELACEHMHITLDEALAQNAQLRDMTVKRAASTILRRRSPRLHRMLRSAVGRAT
jgi:SAM-dependent methyltransferase